MVWLIRTSFVVLFFSITFLGNAQEIKVYSNYDSFKHNLSSNSDTVFFVNFWATWCVPCRKEMPDIQRAYQHLAGKKVQFLLVSLDDASKIEKGLRPFLSENDITIKTVILDDPDFNSWIDKVEGSWDGSLPATLVFKKNSKSFFNKPLSYQEILTIIEQKL